MKNRNLLFIRMVWILSLFLALLPFSAKAGETRSFFRYAAILTRDGNPEASARILLGHYTATINSQDTNDGAVLSRKKVASALPAGSAKAHSLIDANNCKRSVDSASSVTSGAPVEREIASDFFAVPDVIPAFDSISGGSSASIDFQLSDGLIYMQVSLNGSKPLWMMLDSGSSISVFDQSVSNALGLTLHGEENAYGPGQGSTQKLAFANHTTLTFGGGELTDQTVGTLPLDWFSREVGRSTDGFLGSNVFRKFVVEIDYSDRVLRLYDPAVYSYSGPGHHLPLEFAWDNIPSVRAEVIARDGTSISGIFLIDTGSADAIWLTKAFTDAHPELLSADESIEVPSVVAVGGEVRSLLGQVPAIRLGGFVVSELITQFSQNTSGLFAAPSLAGIIGAETLRRFTVIFDYSHREMILQPNAYYSDAESRGYTAKCQHLDSIPGA